MTDYLTRIETFTEATLPDLDEVVMGALEFLQGKEFPRINTLEFKRPLVVGSGNALQTGKLIFDDTDAHFVEETGLSHALARGTYDALYLFSASGGKHAIELARMGVESKLPVRLITSNEHAPAMALIGREQTSVYPHIREPYTYNVSTYLAMLMGQTGEDASTIRTWIEKEVAPLLDGSDFTHFTSYLMALPGEYKAVRRMYETKFDELFGPHLLARTYTFEEVKHAKTVITSDTQCFVGFGATIPYGNPGLRLVIPLPEALTPATLVSIGYYVIGRIQKAHPPYFKENIGAYVEEASGMFGHPISIIVP